MHSGDFATQNHIAVGNLSKFPFGKSENCRQFSAERMNPFPTVEVVCNLQISIYRAGSFAVLFCADDGGAGTGGGFGDDDLLIDSLLQLRHMGNDSHQPVALGESG